MPKTKIDGYRCLRCGHEWKPRKSRLPGWCPKCNSPYWNQRRKREVNNG